MLIFRRSNEAVSASGSLYVRGLLLPPGRSGYILSYMYLTFGKPLGWQVEVLTNSTLLVANPSCESRVRPHPVSGSSIASLSGTQQRGGCCGGEVQGASRVGVPLLL